MNKASEIKIILILLDGIGDRSYRELGNKTPLQSAHTPNLDRLAALGSNGLYHASFSGECLPSEIAHYLMFGYDIRNFPGRGLLEAAGEKVPFNDNDVLCLSHLANVKLDKGVPTLTGGRDNIAGTKEELSKLFSLVSDYNSHGIRIKLVQTRRNDAIIVLSGRVSPFISDSDPITIGKPVARVLPLEDNSEPETAEKTALAVNDYLSFCHKTLRAESAKANFLVSQRCGRRIRQETFEDIWGLKGMLMASGSVYWGLAQEVGMGFAKVKDSAHAGRDLNERIKRAIDDNSHNFIHVHTKVPDEAAHKGSPEIKRDKISELDKGLEGLADSLKSENLLIAITGDHSTPSRSALIHSGEPVPLIIAGPDVRTDTVSQFDEIQASQGCLGFLRGRELVMMLLNYSDRSALKSHQLGSVKRPYYPKNYPPFKI